ncbi:hypothetical protein LOD99_8842 [Oopsacas minuta]|uniref:Uncharacterized protein n=1 Tax=Oopsacas minuta TaxID=111878 RepID=A0AAV7JEK2_9METZ|nr:hypothetical protein LOD99_8842 [Oopsacas minuta]
MHHLAPSIRQNETRKMQGAPLAARTPRLRKVVFLDENLFTVEEETNRQIDRIFSTTTKNIPVEVKFVDRVQKPQSVMVRGGLTSNWRRNLIFIPKGVK